MSSKKVRSSTKSKVLDLFLDDTPSVQKVLILGAESQKEIPQKERHEITVRLHVKDFLQPFEKILAENEIRGLDIDLISKENRSNIFVVKINPTLGTLARLTYFDWMVSDTFRPTLQACREGAHPQASRIDSSFPRRRILRFGPHGLHEYKGKFFPQLVRSLCNSSGLTSGSKVLDPMCGSGTSLVELRALDMCALGLDRNPLSVLITDVKTSSIGWSVSRVAEIQANITSSLTSNNDHSINLSDAEKSYLERWFDTQASHEISGIVSKINGIDDTEARKYALVCLSDILRGISYQKLSDLRVRKEIRPYIQGQATRFFEEKVKSNLKAIGYLIRVDHGHNMPYSVKVGDARHLDENFKSEIGKIDAVITSPPYAMALPYLDTDRLSLIMLGLLPRSKVKEAESDMVGTREITEKQRRLTWANYLEHRDKLPASVRSQIDDLAKAYHSMEVGFRRRNLPALLAKYFFDMNSVLKKIHLMLSSESHAFIIIGNNSTIVDGSRKDIQTDKLIVDMASEIGFKIMPSINMELLISRDIFKCNRCSKETIIQLMKN